MTYADSLQTALHSECWAVCQKYAMQRHERMCLREQGGGESEGRVHVWRRVKLDLLEPWSEHACCFDDSRPPEEVNVCLDDGTRLSGTRHRLQVLSFCYFCLEM